MNTKKQQIAKLQRRLNIANSTVFKQMEAIEKLSKMYESQLAVQDKAINRLFIIQNYLEEKTLKVYDEKI